MSSTATAVPVFLLATMFPVEAEATAASAHDETAAVAYAADEQAAAYSNAQASYSAFAPEWKVPSLPISVGNMALDSDGYAPLFRRALGVTDMFGAGAMNLTSLSAHEPFDMPLLSEANTYNTSLLAAFVGLGLFTFLGVFLVLYRNRFDRRPDSAGADESDLVKEAIALAKRDNGRTKLTGAFALGRPENMGRVGGEKIPSIAPPMNAGHTYGKGGMH